MRKRTSNDEPYWAPLPRQRFTPTQTLTIVIRHLIPLIGLFFYDGSAGQFLILSVFNIAFTIACIGTLGIAVSTRQENGPSPNIADEIVAWLLLLTIGIVVSLVLTTMFGWVIAIFVAATPEGLFTATLAWSVLAIVVFASPGLFQQYRSDLRSGMNEEQRKQRDQPNVLVHVLCAGLIFMLSGYINDFGRHGLLIAAVIVTALFIFRDLRPDLMRELTRPKTRPPGS